MSEEFTNLLLICNVALLKISTSVGFPGSFMVNTLQTSSELLSLVNTLQTSPKLLALSFVMLN